MFIFFCNFASNLGGFLPLIFKDFHLNLAPFPQTNDLKPFADCYSRGLCTDKGQDLLFARVEPEISESAYIEPVSDSVASGKNAQP